MVLKFMYQASHYLSIEKLQVSHVFFLKELSVTLKLDRLCPLKKKIGQVIMNA